VNWNLLVAFIPKAKRIGVNATKIRRDANWNLSGAFIPGAEQTGVNASKRGTQCSETGREGNLPHWKEGLYSLIFG
jgi:hypothetical protein